MEDAIKVRDRKRKVVPPVYNKARLSEIPLPVLVLATDEADSDTDDREVDATDPLEASTNDPVAMDNNESDLDMMFNNVNTSMLSASIESSESIVSRQNDDEMDNSNTSDVPSPNFSAIIASGESIAQPNTNKNRNALCRLDDAIASTVSTNIELVEVNVLTNYTASNNGTSSNLVDSIDSSVARVNENNGLLARLPNTNYLALLTDPIQSVSTNSSAGVSDIDQNILSEAINSSLNIQIKHEPVFSPLNDEDCGLVGNILDGSFEKVNDSDDDILIHRNDIVPQPKKDNMIPYTVKTNDIISGNIPFATNVSVANLLHLSLIVKNESLFSHSFRQRAIVLTSSLRAIHSSK